MYDIKNRNIINNKKKADHRVIKNNKKKADQSVIFIAGYCELLIILLENSVQSIVVPVKNNVNISNTEVFRNIGIASEMGSGGHEYGDGVDGGDWGGVDN